jgi:beta-lactamase regulating signal transducer with metallopeptidase domain
LFKIKNLIIGNNKYKSIYERIVRRLLGLINDYYLNHLLALINATATTNADRNNRQKSPSPATATSVTTAAAIVALDSQLVDTINQILAILSSFALGNMEHCAQLVSLYILYSLESTKLNS